MIEIFFIREVIAVAGTLIAAYTDIKEGLIYDFVTLPMIAIGALLNIFENRPEGFLFAGLVFGIGYLMYFAGKIGGGDVKLFSGLTMIIPTIGESIFILNVLIFSGLMAIVFLSTYYSLKYFGKVKSFSALFEENKKGITKGIVLCAFLVFYFFFLLSNSLVPQSYVLVIGSSMAFGIVFISLEKGIRERIFLQKIEIEKLEEEELIAREFMDEKTLKELNLGAKGIIDKPVLEKLKELKIREILVYRNLPKFAPFILIGVLAGIFLPEFFAFLG